MTIEMEIPKYSRLEIEKKWIIDSSKIPDISSLKKLEVIDKYFLNTRTRLRKILDTSNGKVIYKLCKKYGKISEISEPITNLYLSKGEYEMFNALPGATLRKHKYHFHFKNRVFSIEEFIEPKKDFYLLEIELSSEDDFSNLDLPSFIKNEVANIKEYEGYYIATSI